MSRAALAAALVLMLAGCAQIFGLDETHDQSGDIDADVDADIDAPPGACSPFDSTNCQTGTTCDLDPSSFGPTCRPEGGLGQLASCGQSEDCAAGLTCLYGACRSWCGSDGDCTGAENHCHLTNYIGQVCDSYCDLRDSGDGGCGVGYYCAVVPMPDGSQDLGAVCVPGSGGTVADGGLCQIQEECIPGTVCATPDGVTYQCMRWCYINDPNNCASGQCVPLDQGGGLIVHGAELGVCYIP